MNVYRIVSRSGIDLGEYCGNSPEEAVRAMNRDAGYSTDEAALAVTGQAEIMEGLRVTEMERCLYCSSEELFSHDDKVPAVDDDEEWERLANLHDADCEWVRTRAHRVVD